ncbi:MAG: cadherin repeat domain-containing protein, partial [Bacteroidia bacterium]
MKNLINYKTIIYCMVLIGLAFSGCKEDDKPEPDPVDTTSQDTTVSCNAFAKTIEENPASNMILGTLDGSSNKGSVTFSLLTEVPTGAFTVDATSGELSVADNSLFTIATNPTLTGTFAVQNGSETTNCTITITLKDTVSSDLPDCGEDPEYSKVYDGAVQLKSQEDIDSFTSS